MRVGEGGGDVADVEGREEVVPRDCRPRGFVARRRRQLLGHFEQLFLHAEALDARGNDAGIRVGLGLTHQREDILLQLTLSLTH